VEQVIILEILNWLVAGWKMNRYIPQEHSGRQPSMPLWEGDCLTTIALILQGERKNQMSLQTVLIWIVIGAIAGILAESMVGGPRRGGLGTAILIGILGAFIGGWLFSALGIAIGGGIIGTIITAFIGAIVLLLIVRAVRR
jgi:uncharacterized membrane protein YeaQ/YmgE (transglycosylase-associated protein family)